MTQSVFPPQDGPMMAAIAQHMGEQLDDLVDGAGADDTTYALVGRIVELTERHGLGVGGLQVLLAVAVRRLADQRPRGATLDAARDGDQITADQVTRERFGR